VPRDRPLFIEKVHDVVGLYFDPPEAAMGDSLRIPRRPRVAYGSPMAVPASASASSRAVVAGGSGGAPYVAART
jgi:hypothetical protein